MLILGIDPGNTDSAYAVIDQQTRRAKHFGKVANHALMDQLGAFIDQRLVDQVAIEMVESFGMAVGREVFETCVWIGRFQQTALSSGSGTGTPVELVYRGRVKMHHCHTRAAKDPNIIQALVDRFTPGQPNKGKGTKADPGWFHGFAKDVWQAYALAVYVADTAPACNPRSAVPAVASTPAAGTAPAQGAMF